MSEIADSLLERLNEKLTTYDLLRVVQTYSEISKNYPKLFLQLEQLFLRRFDQLSVEEMTTCAAGFAVSGFGSPYFSNLLEQGVLASMGKFDHDCLKEVTRGFVFSQRGSKTLFSMLLPRIRPILHEFSLSELCMLLHSYHDKTYLPKQFAAEIESQVKKLMLERAENLEPNELSLIARAFCKARTASREFHKLLET